MANYKQTAVVGESWVRASRVIIDNPLDGIPSISFVEQEVVNIPGAEPITRLVGNVGDSMSDPSTQFPLLDPDTGLETGQITTYGAGYQWHFSLYRHLAKKRDEA